MSENTQSRRSFFKGTMAAAVAAAVPASAEAQKKAAVPSAKKPNIILYLADQFRADFVGANGRNGSTRTPNIDALAARGKNFTHAVTNQPVCAPARSVLLTSRYATETGVWHNGLMLDKSLPTIASELRKEGYTSNLIGKWHLALGNPKAGGDPGPVKQRIAEAFWICGRGRMHLNTQRIPMKARSGTRTTSRFPLKISIGSIFSLIVRKNFFARSRISLLFCLFHSWNLINKMICRGRWLPRERLLDSPTRLHRRIFVPCLGRGRISFRITTAALRRLIPRWGEFGAFWKRRIWLTTPSLCFSAIMAATL